jgi:hypothetical protein
VAGTPPAVLFMTAFFAMQAILAGSSFALDLPFLTYQPPYWRLLLINGCGGSYVSYICWRQSPRARFAAYIFLTVDVVRATRGGHWWTVAIDLAVIGIMQLPAFRAAYPSIRPATVWRRQRSLYPTPVNGQLGPHGGEQPTNGRGRMLHT